MPRGRKKGYKPTGAQLTGLKLGQNKKWTSEMREKVRKANQGKNNPWHRMSKKTKKKQLANLIPGYWLGKRRKHMEGGKNWAWKGDKVGYTALHDWVRKKKGKAKMCEFCGTTEAKAYHWANKSRKYKRDLDDWLSLCQSCHWIYDKVNKR